MKNSKYSECTILRGSKLRNSFFETIEKHIGNQRVVFLKNVKMRQVVAMHFYMIKIEYFINFSITIAWTDAPHVENHQKCPTIK
jgi:hypothetical protein